MGEVRDSTVWAGTCDLKAQVLRNDRRPLAARAALPGAVLVGVGLALLFVVPAAVGLVVVALGVVPLLAAAVVLAAGGVATGHLMLEADGFTYRAPGAPALTVEWRRSGRFVATGSRWAPGRVRWPGADGGRPGALLPGAGGLPAEDLALLLDRYRRRYAPEDGATPDAGAAG